jgi:aldehyde dehydrogenase (NAD+)
MMSIAYDYSCDGSPATLAAKPKLLLIDGRRVPSASGRTFESLNPATEQVIATIAKGDEIDVDRAVAAARRAFEGPWRTMRAAERGHVLLKWADLLKKHVDEIAELESLDAGKPIAAVLRQDFPAAIDTLTYYAGWADKISGEVVSTRDDALTYTVREPVGVVAAIVPWNFPLMIGMWKLAPALACGCTVVTKPAELTSLSALRIAELALEAGLPPGVLNIVTGPGRVVGDALVNHPDLDKVTFTGSPGVGRGIMRRAAGNFKRVSLELGGKSANVIFDDADLDAASKAAAAGIFFNAGQVCSAGSRVLVHEKVYDEVVERLTARAKALRIGDPSDRATVLGPVISEKQMKSILDYVDIGQKEGALLTTGGERVGDRGYFISPPPCLPTSSTRCASRRKRSLARWSASSSSVTKPMHYGSPTAPPTAWPRASGAATWGVCSASPRRREPARSGSTPMAIPTCDCPGVVSATPALAANMAPRRSITSPSRRPSG